MNPISHLAEPLVSTETQDTIYYPERDGKPMGETDYHISAILHLLATLRYFFRNAPDVYVAGDMLFYYEQGSPSLYVVPDVFVVKGTNKTMRRIYRLWQEQVAPNVVFEISSRSTRLEDTGTKRALYELIGVREYFIFDPLNEYLPQQLQGFRLNGDSFQPLLLSSEGALYSEELGLALQPDGYLLRPIDPATGQFLPTMDEAMALAQAEAERAELEAGHAKFEAERAELEAERANDAEAEVARLRAELDRLRGESK